MNPARGIFGAVVAAGALAAIVTFLAQFWPSAQSPPQPIEATRKADSLARPESVAQEFADLPKSVRTVPVTRQAAPSPSPPVQQAPAARVAADPAVPATLPAHPEPVGRLRALWRPSRQLHARASCDVALRLSAASVKGKRLRRSDRGVQLLRSGAGIGRQDSTAASVPAAR
jgi:hypothetical protein